MEVIAEEGPETMADLIEVGGRIQSNTRIVDADNHINLNKSKRVRKDVAFTDFGVDAAVFGER